ncbi:MAG: type II toxin-antitoxin system PemK/MazF family toxin [Oscillospiraceae bacterium]
MDSSVKRGDIFYADLSPVVGSEQGGVRPVLIVQNDTGNRHSPTVIAAAITSQTGKARLPTHIELLANQYGLPKESVVLLEQIRTLDKKRLREKMGRLDEDLMGKVDAAIAVSFGLHGETLV